MAKGAGKSGRKGNAQSGVKKRILLSAMVLTSIAILPTTVVFFIGMMPTIAARVADKSRQRTRTMTIGFMNFAACFPFWYKMLQHGHTFEGAVAIISDPFNISVMYGGALVGYMIEWALAGFVAGFMAQKARKRLEAIKKTQEDLVERWGREVTGDFPLDPYGFPIENKEK